MIYRSIQPSPQLRAFVNEYCLLHFRFDKHIPALMKPFPVRPQQCIVFYLRGGVTAFNYETGASTTFAKTSVNGPQLSRLDFQCVVTADFLMLQVVFQPGALHRLLGFSTNELTSQFCDAESIINPELHSINDQIANANNYNEMIERAEVYLLRKLRNLKIDAHPIDRIGALLLHNPTPISLGWPGLDWPGLDWLANQANYKSSPV